MPTTGVPFIDALLVYGPLGIVVALFVVGKIHTESEVAGLRRDKDTLLGNNTVLADSTRRMAEAWEAEHRAAARARGDT